MSKTDWKDPNESLPKKGDNVLFKMKGSDEVLSCVYQGLVSYLHNKGYYDHFGCVHTNMVECWRYPK